jgi:cob(I)alamin adenosyltransferase
MNNNHEALARKVEQLEAFRAEVQAICESGKHRTMHTQSQMCGFLDGIRFKAMKARIDRHDEADNAAALALEARARAIYEGWSAQSGFVPWVESGNSAMQDEARAQARRAMEIA